MGAIAQRPNYADEVLLVHHVGVHIQDLGATLRLVA